MTTRDESRATEHALIAPEKLISLLADGKGQDIRPMDNLYCSFIHLSHQKRSKKRFVNAFISSASLSSLLTSAVKDDQI